jgi:hypothetical protein
MAGSKSPSATTFPISTLGWTVKKGNQAFHFGDGLAQSLAAYHDHHGKADWAGLIRVTQSGVVQADVNGDGKVDFQIVVHGDHLTKGDFIL